MTRGQVKNPLTDGRFKINPDIRKSPTFKGMYKKYQMAKERCSENYKNHIDIMIGEFALSGIALMNSIMIGTKVI